ncbi:bifunctional diguanylate cyclase/phosphodiesterase [Effusibacillus pohliae]|uniref:bifunctional diguanylate cyclase/phosphodiesterase n=1 Tax=Effusibacillus pohliae TaxID=232270 RepID=UPI000380E5C8|nr:EAL domain-containing protein [Effusibacillus pohliae]
MKTWNVVYDQSFRLPEYLAEHGIHPRLSLLVQIFAGNHRQQRIVSLRDQLRRLLPSAVIIGATSDGEIAGGKVTTGQTVISFTEFAKTTVTSAAVPIAAAADSFAAGREIAQRLVGRNTKAIILFADGSAVNGEDLLRGVESVAPHVVVAGGLTVGCMTGTPDLLFTEQAVLSRGVVGVALAGDDLYVKPYCHFAWSPIGRTMTVTKASVNRVYEIDHQPAVEIYRKYLGTAVADRLASLGSMFPLVLHKHGRLVARACIESHADGSLSFAGNLQTGEQVQFAYADTQLAFESLERATNDLQAVPAKSIFIYACAARRRWMPDLVEAEIASLERMADTSGCFLCGEFYHASPTNQLLNQTITGLILAESDDVRRTAAAPVAAIQEVNGTWHLLRAVSHLVNVTSEELQRSNQALQESEEHYRRLIESCPIGIAVYHDDKIVLANKAGGRIVGAGKPSDVIGRSIFDFIHPDDREAVRQTIVRRIRHGVDEEIQVRRLVRLDGQVIDVETVTIPFQLGGKPAAQIFLQDITERKRYEEQIRHQAYHDTLTGLPNRALFSKYLEETLAKANRDGRLVALMFLDLDRFKTINDTLGHTVGDKLLCAVAERLQHCVGEPNFVARLAGDEFTVLLPGINRAEEAVAVARNVLDALNQPFRIQESELFVTASIGISVYPSDGTTGELLIKHADAAMYRAKEQGSNHYQIFTPGMKEQAFRRLQLENAIRKALERGEFYLLYQPLVDAESGRIVATEALLRWENPQLGVVSPAEFIPIAEDTGLIMPIGDWVLRTACMQNRLWQDAGYPPIRILVNLSARQCLQLNLVENIQQVLAETGLDARWLELEMTESIMQNSTDTIVTLQRLRQLGIRISIDDFGTGYSSLSYLKRLPIDGLKIDRTFMQDIADDRKNAAIVRAIIQMAHCLNLRVTAEGVETREQADYLRQVQCDQMQGFLFSRPLTADAMERLWIARTEKDSAAP